MAHSRSAWKRARQSERRRARNRAARSRLRTEIRKLLSTIKGGDAPKAEAQLRATSRLLDQAAGRGTIHVNKAARHKSRLAARVAAIPKKTA